MKSKSTALAATLFAAVSFTVPATADVILDDFIEDIDGETRRLGWYEVNNEILTIKNGGVLSLTGPVYFLGVLSIVISDNSYLVSTSGDSTATVVVDDNADYTITIGFYGFYNADDGVEISFDSDYLADLVAGAATEYTYLIFDSDISFSTDYPFSVTVDDSWQEVSGVVSVTYDESTRTVTVVVPEPGAFGLFAGVAALALTAARRSRRGRLSRKLA